MILQSFKAQEVMAVAFRIQKTDEVKVRYPDFALRRFKISMSLLVRETKLAHRTREQEEVV